MYTVAIAPHNPKLIFLSCDMGGVYRSEDGGEQWELISFAEGLYNMHFAPMPVILPHRMYWVTNEKQICLSNDQGRSWMLVPVAPWLKHPELQDKNKIVSFTVLPDKDETLLVSTKKGLWLGKGHAWRQVSEAEGGPVQIFGSTVLAAIGSGELIASNDAGKSWQSLASFPGPVAALGAAVGANGSKLLLASVKDHGVFRSTDAGKSWQLCKSPFENETVLTIPPGQTKRAWALQTDSTRTQKLLRSDDGGLSWQSVFRMPPGGKAKRAEDNVEPSWMQTSLFWGYFFTRNGFACAAGNPDFCLVTTQGELYLSRDAGQSWTQQVSRTVTTTDKITWHKSIGLEVTACYAYYTDPHDAMRAYISFADIGFGRSVDKGQSWAWSAKGSPWTNTFYDIAFDPAIPGRIYAAASFRHEIFNFLGTSGTNPEARKDQGGVVMSSDYGASWAPPYAQKGSGALPVQVCTAVVLDPASPVENRVLFASVFGENEAAGVYISADSGKTWKQTPSQPGVLPNRHLARLRLHPQTGELYSLVCGYRAYAPNFFNPEGGGLWRSADQGKTWQHLTKGSPLSRWATAFAFDPKLPQTMYVTAATPSGGKGVGGVYKTVDNGKTWMQVLDDDKAYRLAGGESYDHFMAVAVHPDNPSLVWCGATLKGLFVSEDGGKHWTWCRSFPFSAVQGIAFDPRNTDTVYISTMGAGVWTGSVKDVLRSLHSTGNGRAKIQARTVR